MTLDKLSSDKTFKKKSTVQKKAEIQKQRTNTMQNAVLQGRFAYETELKKAIGKLTKEMNAKQCTSERELQQRMTPRLDVLENEAIDMPPAKKQKRSSQ